ncbi:MAG TPA: glycosyltransferase family 1 protein, partial [Rhodospirillaceae bacterium]|nr:glycosyltransferase family 1 protein [Rhodospirillaceae bacterium]
MPLPSKPHILFFVTEDWYFLSHRMGLARAMMEAGYDVSLITQVDKGAAEIEAAGIHLYPLHIKRSGMNLWRELKTFLRIARIYQKARPDIVHHVALKPVVYGSLAARLVGITRRVNALAGLGFVFSSNSWRARLIKPVVTLLLLIALSGKKARLIVQNADDVSFFKNKKLAPASSIRLVRGAGVDPSRFVVQQENLEQKPLIVLPARLLQDKGVGELVEAARKIIKEKGALARFALVGAPDLQNPASFTPAQVESWEKEGIVECWGWREDMSEV